MELAQDQGDDLQWNSFQRLSMCDSCEELGYVPPSEYAPWILTYGEDERGMLYDLLYKHV